MSIERSEPTEPTGIDEAARTIRGLLQDARRIEGITLQWIHRLRVAGSIMDPEEGQDREDSQAEIESAADIREQTYKLLKRARIPNANERTPFIERGFVFLPVGTQSLPELIVANPDHFQGDDLKHIDRMGGSDLRDYRPPVETVIAVHPTNLFLPGCFGQSLTNQLIRNEEESAKAERRFKGVKRVLLPSVFWAGADLEYSRRNAGRGLFKDSFTGVLDDPSDSYRASLGRLEPTDRLYVSERHAGLYVPHVGAATALVFTGR